MVATPLGNLRDISLRALDVLAAVDVIAAEDTRHSQRLLDAHGIQTRLLAAHQHNEAAAAEAIVRMLAAGSQVALISDAGTPGIADPGTRIVARVRAAGHPVVPVPGPCAAVTALSAAGLADGGFHFAGFLPAKSAARRALLVQLGVYPVPLVCYESPHRIVESVADIAAVLDDRRQILIARELTKVFEEIVCLPLAEATAWLAADPNRVRGEFVLVVSPPLPREGLSPEAERALALLLPALPLKSAVSLASQLTGAPRNLLYSRALTLRADAG